MKKIITDFQTKVEVLEKLLLEELRSKVKTGSVFQLNGFFQPKKKGYNFPDCIVITDDTNFFFKADSNKKADVLIHKVKALKKDFTRCEYKINAAFHGPDRFTDELNINIEYLNLYSLGDIKKLRLSYQINKLKSEIKPMILLSKEIEVLEQQLKKLE